MSTRYFLIAMHIIRADHPDHMTSQTTLTTWTTWTSRSTLTTLTTLNNLTSQTILTTLTDQKVYQEDKCGIPIVWLVYFIVMLKRRLGGRVSMVSEVVLVNLKWSVCRKSVISSRESSSKTIITIFRSSPFCKNFVTGSSWWARRKLLRLNLVAVRPKKLVKVIFARTEKYFLLELRNTFICAATFMGTSKWVTNGLDLQMWQII